MDQLLKCTNCDHPAVDHDAGGCIHRCGCPLTRDLVVDEACKVADAEYLARFNRWSGPPQSS